MAITFSDIIKMYGKDTLVTRENIKEKLYDAPTLHSKYHKYLYMWRKKLIKVENEKNEMFRKKYDYYADHYNKVLKPKEIEWHIKTDKEFYEVNGQYKNLCNEVSQLEDFVKFCSNISFFCQNIVDWEKFMNGVN